MIYANSEDLQVLAVTTMVNLLAAEWNGRSIQDNSHEVIVNPMAQKHFTAKCFLSEEHGFDCFDVLSLFFFRAFSVFRGDTVLRDIAGNGVLPWYDVYFIEVKGVC